MKRKNQNPREYSLQHCKDRARERYDFELLDNDYDALTHQIRNDIVASLFPNDTSKFPRINQEGAQITLIVPLRKRKLVCVFDMDSSLLKTLLPPEQFSEHLS